MPRRTALILCGFLLASGLAALVAIVGPHRGPVFTHWTYEELQSFRTQVSPLIERLKQYGREHDHYPEDLASIGESVPSTRYGQWQYDCYRDGAAFSLRLGDYGKYGFVMLWDSPGGDWYTDT